MRPKMIVALLVGFVAAAGCWAWLATHSEGASADFSVTPGGDDVVVTLDGRRIGTGLFGRTSPSSNLYHTRFSSGTHTLTVSKPGYESARESVRIGAKTSEWYGDYTLRPARQRPRRSLSAGGRGSR